jgi:glycosyltransferase involved in cell wall biosynthesis
MSLPNAIDEPRSRAGVSERAVNQAVFLGAGEDMRCGVGHFTRILSDAVRRVDPRRYATLSLTRTTGSFREIWRAIDGTKAVVCNFPIVAWKRVIIRPLLALALARLRGRRVVLVLHEWGGLHWLRRLTYWPALVFANTIVLFSPLVRKELENDPLMRWAVRRTVLAPLPPNIKAPSNMIDTPLREKLAQARRDGRLVIGYFGSIYPGKQPEALLNIGALLKAKGLRPLMVYAGSFIRGTDSVEQDFQARARTLDVADDVIISGFVASEQALFGLFSEVDAFCYQLSEGLSARRASILTVVQSGRPVIVTAPADPFEFAHHPGFRTLISQGSVVLMDRNADDAAYADAIMAAVKRPSAPVNLDFDAWWHDVASAIAAHA